LEDIKAENSFLDENTEILEMDCLEMVPFDGELGADYESDYTV
jgi:hypothetical protein